MFHKSIMKHAYDSFIEKNVETSPPCKSNAGSKQIGASCNWTSASRLGCPFSRTARNRASVRPGSPQDQAELFRAMDIPAPARNVQKIRVLTSVTSGAQTRPECPRLRACSATRILRPLILQVFCTRCKRPVKPAVSYRCRTRFNPAPECSAWRAFPPTGADCSGSKSASMHGPVSGSGH